MTTFLVIGAAGIVLLVMALVVGDLLEGLLNIDSLAGLDSDVFSTAGVAGLLGGFGFGAAIGLAATGAMVVAIVLGLVIGIGLAWGAGRLTAVLRRQGSGAAPSIRSLVGVEALVITAVPESGLGQVRASYQGHTLTLNARASTALAAGTRVWISQVFSPTSVEVRPLDELLGGPRPALEG